jgi:uncharacterized protein YqgV (UPF0045/DUF77 family)
MHNYLINASIQILPLAQDRHPYAWVDEAILVIQSTGIKHEVGPFTTVLEGRYTEVFDVIHKVNEKLCSMGCAEWITGLQIQIRSNADITGDEKIEKYQ